MNPVVFARYTRSTDRLRSFDAFGIGVTTTL
jgi:hypothetical protein